MGTGVIVHLTVTGADFTGPGSEGRGGFVMKMGMSAKGAAKDLAAGQVLKGNS